MWQNAHRYEGRSEPLTWMLSIAHNKAISAMRKRTEVLGPDRRSHQRSRGRGGYPRHRRAEAGTRALRSKTCWTSCRPSIAAVLDLVYYQEQSVAESPRCSASLRRRSRPACSTHRKKLSELLLGARHRPGMAVMKDEETRAPERARRDRSAVALVRDGQARCAISRAGRALHKTPIPR